MLEPFDALIGTWATEATHPSVDAVVPGSATFEWLEGGRFLIQRSHHDHELFPDSICVFRAPRPATGWSCACGAITRDSTRASPRG